MGDMRLDHRRGKEEVRFLKENGTWAKKRPASDFVLQ